MMSVKFQCALVISRYSLLTLTVHFKCAATTLPYITDGEFLSYWHPKHLAYSTITRLTSTSAGSTPSTTCHRITQEKSWAAPTHCMLPLAFTNVIFIRLIKFPRCCNLFMTCRNLQSMGTPLWAGPVLERHTSISQVRVLEGYDFESWNRWKYSLEILKQGEILFWNKEKCNL